MSKVFLIVSVFFLGILTSCFDTSLPTLPSFEEQLAIDTEKIDSHLTANDIVTEIHESKIRYIVTEEGVGSSPTVRDSVNVKYTAKLLDGTLVDSSVEGTTFHLARLVQAWQIMLPLIKTGGQITIYSPSVYSYGRSARGPIPSNANIIFDVELVEVIEN
ncbi:MAG: FKBP-type peptidyl-prolyl cis-trans isomerase [Cyclobacteriaceae bacterium]